MTHHRKEGATSQKKVTYMSIITTHLFTNLSVSLVFLVPIVEPGLVLGIDLALVNLVDSIVLLYPPFLGIGWLEVTQRQDVQVSDCECGVCTCMCV